MTIEPRPLSDPDRQYIVEVTAEHPPVWIWSGLYAALLHAEQRIADLEEVLRRYDPRHVHCGACGTAYLPVPLREPEEHVHAGLCEGMEQAERRWDGYCEDRRCLEVPRVFEVDE